MSTPRGLGRGLGALIPPGPRPPVPELFGPPAPADRGEGAGEEAREGDGGARPDASGPAGDGYAADGSSGGDEGLQVVPGARYTELPVDAVVPNPRQPRQVFDDEAHAELVHSVREIGLLQPVVVRPAPGQPGRFELVAGERRWRAVQAAGLATIPAIVRETADTALLRDALLENLHRAQLNPLEEAAAYSQLLQDFGCTQDELARRIGRSRPQVSNTLRLLRLPAPVQRRVAAGVLSAGHARALLTLPDAAEQERLAGRVVAEGLSVRAVEEIVALAGPEERPRRARGRAGGIDGEDDGGRAELLAALADRVADRLDTRVRAEVGRSRGRLVVDVADLDDLRRVVDLIAPEAGAGG